MTSIGNGAKTARLAAAALASTFIAVSTAQGASTSAIFGMHTGATRNYIKEGDTPTLGSGPVDFSDALDLGIKWERPGPGVNFPLNTDFTDWIFTNIPADISTVGNIYSPRIPGTLKLRTSEQEYAAYVQSVVERYDGDGVEDAPGLKSPVRYWQIDNEPPFYLLISDGVALDPNSLEEVYDTTWEDYARIIELAAQAMETCADCKLVLGGMAGPPTLEMYQTLFERFYDPILKKLGGKHIDVFDAHLFGSAQSKQYLLAKDLYPMIRGKLDQYGYTDTEIWFMETGTYSGKPVGEPATTEREQAADMVARFTYLLAQGARKVFWAWAMVEGFAPALDDNDFFDNTGLIYDGVGPNDKGYGVKKLAYYSYKKLVEKLAQTDPSRITTRTDADGVHVVEFMKEERPVWVVWSDSASAVEVTIDGVSTGEIMVSEAVPMSESGAEVSDYSAAFGTRTVSVVNGAAVLTVSGRTPVYVEFGPAGDATPPSVPAGLSAAAASSSRIELSWTASTDDTGVEGYRVYRDGVEVATVFASSHTDAGLKPSTTYTYAVAAYDAAGNTSALSATASTATTPSVSITAPGGQWGAAVPIASVNTSGTEKAPAVSADGRELYFFREEPGTGSFDLYVSARDGSSWGAPTNDGLLAVVNRPGSNDVGPFVSRDGLKLFFSSNRPGGNGGYDLYYSTRGAQGQAWGAPANLGTAVNSATDSELGPTVSADGTTLYFTRGWPPGDEKEENIFYSSWAGNAWGVPTKWEWNTSQIEDNPELSPDAAQLFLTIRDDSLDKSHYPGSADFDIYVSSFSGGRWNKPVNAGSGVNGPGHDGNAALSADGRTLYFTSQDRSDGAGGFDLYYSCWTSGPASSPPAAGWDAPLRLSSSAAVSSLAYNNAHLLRAVGETLHLVFSDARAGNAEIYYRRSDDAGATWGAERRLSASAGISWYPSVAAGPDGTVHVVWDDDRSGTRAVYYRRSADGGVTWDAETSLSAGAGKAWYPDVAVDARGRVVAVWQDQRHGAGEVYLRRSLDGGKTWEAETRLTQASYESERPTLAVDGKGRLHLAWYDWRDDRARAEVYYARSSDGGATWGAQTRLTTSSGTASSGLPALASDGGDGLHLVYYRGTKSVSGDVYYLRSADGGAAWSAPARLTGAATSSLFFPVVVAESSRTIHAAWQDLKDGDDDLYYRRSADGGATWEAEARLTAEASSSAMPSLAAASGRLHMVWEDTRDGNREIYYSGKVEGFAGPADTTPPSVPAGLSAAAASSSRIELSWTASTDDMGVDGYRVYRDEVEVATVFASSYTDAGLASATTYTYAVAAYDAAGNTSERSATASAATPAAALLPYEDSPFGFHANLAKEEHLEDSGAKWIRLSGPVGLVWDADEPAPGELDWSRMDRVVAEYAAVGRHLLVTVNSFNRLDQDGSNLPRHGIPNNMEMYKAYLRAAAGRYPQIRYFQIENEPANEWADTPENLAVLARESCSAIREANPAARIVLAGAAVPGEFAFFYEPLLRKLKELESADGVRCLDAVDLHWSGQFEDGDKSQADYKTETISGRTYDLKTELGDIRYVLDGAGFKDVPIWVTEMSDYSGEPSDSAYLGQSEREHAAEVFKRYAYSMAAGVKKIFWVALMEFHNYGGMGVNNYWDNVGLVNDPRNDGESHKKLAYYGYKKLVEKLEGSDWDAVGTVRESSGVYAYRFDKESGPVWVLWNDNESDVEMTIPGIGAAGALVTEAVPMFESGEQVADYAAAFATRTVAVSGGRVMIVLSSGSPVYVEGSAGPAAPLLPYEDSPFGFVQGSFTTDYNYDPTYRDMLDLGVYWDRPYEGFTLTAWDSVESARTGKGVYDFSAPDAVLADAFKSGVNLFLSMPAINFLYGSTCQPPPADDPDCSMYPTDPDALPAFKDYVKAVVARYSPRVKYWMVGQNEFDDLNPLAKPLMAYGAEGIAKMASYTRAGCEGIKEACPDCRPVIGGAVVPMKAFARKGDDIPPILSGGEPETAAEDGVYVKLLSELGDSCQDLIIDYHLWTVPGAAHYRAQSWISKKIRELRPDADIWITETGSSEMLDTSESDQAAELVRMYAYGLAQGQQKIFWTNTLEYCNFGGQADNIFNFMGLINNPCNDGTSHKKLAYYGYKKMVEKLEGSDWDAVETVRESSGVYAYRFDKESGPVWVLWNDNESEAEVTIPGIEAAGALVTEAVPMFESGEQVADYAAAFATRTVAATGGTAVVRVSSRSPVYVEPSMTAGPDKTAKVTVDCGQDAGEFSPYLFGTTLDPTGHEMTAAAGFTWTGIPAPLLARGADPEDPDSYDFSASERELSDAVENGLEPVVIYDAGEVMPADMDRFSAYVANSARYVAKGWGGGGTWGVKMFRFGNEPDNAGFWHGTRDEYFELYAAWAKALKGVDENFVLSAPALMLADTEFSPAGIATGSWTRNFLEYASRNSVPLDIFTFHAYSPFSYYQFHAKPRLLLAELGRYENLSPLNGAPLLGNDEWNMLLGDLWRGNEYAAQFDTLWAAASNINSLINMHEAGVALSQRYGGTYNGPAGECHDFPLTDCDRKAKPSLQAFRAFNKLAGSRRLSTSGTDHVNFAAAAGMKGNRIIVVLSNFDTRRYLETFQERYVATPEGTIPDPVWTEFDGHVGDRGEPQVYDAFDIELANIPGGIVAGAAVLEHFRVDDVDGLVKVEERSVAGLDKLVFSGKMEAPAVHLLIVRSAANADSSPPAAPAGLAAAPVSPSRIELSWTASTDDTGVEGYRVYRDGVEVATVFASSYTDAGLASATTYTYAVAAYDAAGNTSALSATASAATPAAPLLPYEDSPFGMHPAYTYDDPETEELRLPPSQAGFSYDRALDLGVKWNRPGYYVIWNLVQKGKEDVDAGRYDWSETDYVLGNVPAGMATLANIGGFESRLLTDDSQSPPVRTFRFVNQEVEDKYIEFVKKAVERYSALERPVKYWQVHNEPDLFSTDWEGFARLQRITYEAVKSKCADCKVLIGGAAGGKAALDEFFGPAIAALDGDYVDVFDFHHYEGEGAWKAYKGYIGEIKMLFPRKDIEIWTTETGTWSGGYSGPDGSASPSQSEGAQASSLVKRYAYGLAAGVKKIFWAWGMVEGFGGDLDDNDLFDNTGLVYDGHGGSDPGYGVKKLAYYGYKKMVEKLEGSDWDAVGTVCESSGVYAYRFDKESGPVWVLWNDNEGEVEVTIPGIEEAGALVTEAVPMFESGADVADYAVAFATRTVAATGGTAVVRLSSRSPVYVEPAPAAPPARAAPLYFHAIHNEAYNNPNGMTLIRRDFATLRTMIEQADARNIKLTLMFTPQWADLFLSDARAMNELESWKAGGHEIAVHHHGIDHGNWDGYGDASPREIAARRAAAGVSPPEAYWGSLDDLMKRMDLIRPGMRTGCVNDERDKDELPDAVVYDTCSGYYNYGEPGTYDAYGDGPDKGRNEYVLTGLHKGITRKWLSHAPVTTFERQEAAQMAFAGLRSTCAYGSANHSVASELEAFTAWLEFLHAQDPAGARSRTLSEILDSGMLQERKLDLGTEDPEVSITSPADGAKIIGGVSVVVEAAGGTKVRLYVDAAAWAEDSSAPYIFVLDTTELSAGEHTLAVEAYSAAGATAAARVSVSVKSSTAVRHDTGETVSAVVAERQVTVEIPAESFTETVWVSVSTPAVLPDAGPDQLGTGVAVEIELSKPLQPARAVTLTLGYTDGDVRGLDEGRLMLARYDEDGGKWIELDSAVDPAGRTVTAETDHFSLFQIMQSGSAAGSLEEARVRPNPFRPARGHSRVVFDRLPAHAEVSVHTLRGRRVWSGSADASGALEWHGRNKSGAAAASGVYLAVVKSGGRNRILKVAVVR